MLNVNMQGVKSPRDHQVALSSEALSMPRFIWTPDARFPATRVNPTGANERDLVALGRSQTARLADWIADRCRGIAGIQRQGPGLVAGHDRRQPGSKRGDLRRGLLLLPDQKS